MEQKEEERRKAQIYTERGARVGSGLKHQRRPVGNGARASETGRPVFARPPEQIFSGRVHPRARQGKFASGSRLDAPGTRVRPRRDPCAAGPPAYLGGCPAAGEDYATVAETASPRPCQFRLTGCEMDIACVVEIVRAGIQDGVCVP